MAIPAVLFEPKAGSRATVDRAINGEAGYPVLAHDLSCDGFSMEAIGGLNAGAPILIDLPGAGLRAAAVGAHLNGLSRCHFVEPLPPALLPRIFALSARHGGDPLPEPHVRKWPRAIRIMLPVCLTLLLWAVVLFYLR